MSFAARALEEAIGELVAEIRSTTSWSSHLGKDTVGTPPRPHPRPSIPVAAFDAAGGPGAFPEAASRTNREATTTPSGRAAHRRHPREKFLELGLESPFDARSGSTAGTRTTRSPRRSTSAPASANIRRRALLAHATQVDPTSKFCSGCLLRCSRHYPLRRLPHADRGPRRGGCRRLTCWPCSRMPSRSRRNEVLGGEASAATPCRRRDLYKGTNILRLVGSRLSGSRDPNPVMKGTDMAVVTREGWTKAKLAEYQPERPGATARMQYVVTGRPGRGHRDAYWVLRERQASSRASSAARRRRGDA